jgi:hypothetical protein
VYTAFGATPTRPAMPRTDAAAHAALVEQAQRGVQDLVLAERPARPRSSLRPVLVIDALLDGFCTPYSIICTPYR